MTLLFSPPQSPLLCHAAIKDAIIGLVRLPIAFVAVLWARESSAHFAAAVIPIDRVDCYAGAEDVAALITFAQIKGFELERDADGASSNLSSQDNLSAVFFSQLPANTEKDGTQIILAGQVTGRA